MATYEPFEERAGESAPREAALAPEQDTGVALTEVLSGGESGLEAAEPPKGEATDAQVQGQGEELRVNKGYQGRVNAQINKAVARATKELEARNEESFARLHSLAMGMQANALVGAGKFGDRETALEYLARGQEGQAAKATLPPDAVPRGGQESLASWQAQVEAEAEQKAKALMRQREGIVASGGPDVLRLYVENKAVRRRVNAGQWDFADVAAAWRDEKEKKQIPPPVRMPNHIAAGRSPLDMTDAELDRINQTARSGQKINLRR